ncbi:MAG: DNA-processing protein DprA [Candidatus Omnitrophica bacterium]|nr:DNA-processing protein DprA [Candidatus Omnitrophota bacterium]
MKHGVVTIENSKYPKLLKEIPSYPKRIYYKGSWDTSIFENCLAVVGSRKMTTYGKQITTKLVSEISNAGITIVSGFMYGIDATAHKAALNVGGKTIAVMPCGIDMVHPQHQKSLYNEILENKGLVISEFEGSFPPAVWTYPKRNRIVAGLSKATMVVEAGEKSGSLITAGLAKNYKRRLFVVPGPLTGLNSQGILQLIKNGADIVTSSKDVLASYDTIQFEFPKVSSRLLRLNSVEQAVLEELQHEPMGIDEISRFVKTSVAKVGTILSFMRLKGILLEEKGKYYVNSTRV